MRSFIYLLLTAPLLASCAPYDHKRNANQGDLGKRKDYSGNPPTQCSPSAPPPSSTSCMPITTPTQAYTVKASSPGTEIDNLPMNAGSLGFRLGGETSTFCPSSVGPLCPPGNVTAFTAGTISVMVPGGQQQWAQPSGRIGYTQAHSLSRPVDSQPHGFGYSKCPDEEFGHLVQTSFGADGLMACPEASTFGNTTIYVVFGKVPDAVVPSGNVEDCIDFDGLTTDYTGRIPAAWQY